MALKDASDAAVAATLASQVGSTDRHPPSRSRHPVEAKTIVQDDDEANSDGGSSSMRDNSDENDSEPQIHLSQAMRASSAKRKGSDDKSSKASKPSLKSNGGMREKTDTFTLFAEALKTPGIRELGEKLDYLTQKDEDPVWTYDILAPCDEETCRRRDKHGQFFFLGTTKGQLAKPEYVDGKLRPRAPALHGAILMIANRTYIGVGSHGCYPRWKKELMELWKLEEPLSEVFNKLIEKLGRADSFTYLQLARDDPEKFVAVVDKFIKIAGKNFESSITFRLKQASTKSAGRSDALEFVANGMKSYVSFAVRRAEYLKKSKAESTSSVAKRATVVADDTPKLTAQNFPPLSTEVSAPSQSHCLNPKNEADALMLKTVDDFALKMMAFPSHLRDPLMLTPLIVAALEKYARILGTASAPVATSSTSSSPKCVDVAVPPGTTVVVGDPEAIKKHAQEIDDRSFAHVAAIVSPEQKKRMELDSIYTRARSDKTSGKNWKPSEPYAYANHTNISREAFIAQEMEKFNREEEAKEEEAEAQKAAAFATPSNCTSSSTGSCSSTDPSPTLPAPASQLSSPSSSSSSSSVSTTPSRLPKDTIIPLEKTVFADTQLTNARILSASPPPIVGPTPQPTSIITYATSISFDPDDRDRCDESGSAVVKGDVKSKSKDQGKEKEKEK